MTAFALNTNVIELTGLKNALTDAYLNDAAVSVTVRDLRGTNVAGASWPLAMDYVAASDGDYRAILPATLVVIDGARYEAVVEANGGADLVGHWEFRFNADVRR